MTTEATTNEPSRRVKVFAFLRHVHPKTVTTHALRPSTTLGLGVIAATLGGLLLVSGVFLMASYIPDPRSAYGSIRDVQSVVPFGGLLRAAHRWAGHGLVAVVGLHLLRALLTGAYSGRERRGVWTAGVWLLVVTLAFAFTGYLLPWDQLSYWAVSIGGHLVANVPVVGGALRRAVLGGDEVGSATLVRFYALHVGILPALATPWLALHLFRLRRAGGLARPGGEQSSDRVPAWPHLFERETALVTLTVAVVIAVALAADAPLGPEPDPAHPEDPSKAPWYFLFLQELVSYSAVLGGVVLPALALTALTALPWFDESGADSGRWLAPRPLAPALFAGGALLGAATVLSGVTWLPSPAFALLLVTLAAGGAAWGLARGRAPGHEARAAVVAVTGVAAAALLTLSLIGWWRGPSWSLQLPWGGG